MLGSKPLSQVSKGPEAGRLPLASGYTSGRKLALSVKDRASSPLSTGQSNADTWEPERQGYLKPVRLVETGSPLITVTLCVPHPCYTITPKGLIFGQ